MKRFLLLIFIFNSWFWINSRSQELSDTDSITQEIASLTDSLKVHRLISLADELKYNNSGKALEYAYQGLEISNNIKSSYELAISHQCIAEIYSLRGHYERALEHFLAALKLFTSLENQTKIAICDNSIGNVFMHTGDYNQASSYFLQALTLNKKLKNIEDIASNYNNIGNAFLLQDSIDKGLSYFLVSLMIADSLKNTTEVIKLLNNIGTGYLRLKKFEMAMNSFEKAAKLSLQQQNQYSLAQSYLNIAKVYNNTNHFSSALKFALKSYQLAVSENYNMIVYETENLLSQIYVSLGNYRNAYHHYVKYKLLSDSIFNDANSKKLAIIQAKYELENSEKENQLLRIRNEESKKTIHRKNIIVSVSSMLILVSLILVFVLLYFNNRFKKLNQILEKQSNELKELNLQKDKFFSFVVHNIKNPFSTIYGFSELMLKSAEKKEQDKMLRYSQYIYDSSEGIKEILNNLLEWSRLQRGSYEYNPVRLDLEGLIKDLVELNNKSAAKKSIALSYENIENKYVYADRQMVYTILQNLISNAIRYNIENGKINLSVVNKGRFIEVTIADTGEGIPEDRIDRIFVFNPSPASATDESRGAGMGLIICKELVTKNGGDITVTSTAGEGSSFSFTLPVPDSELEYIEGREPALSEQINIIKENLRSFHVIPEKFREKLNNELIQKYNHVSKMLSVEELKEFSEILITVGDEYKVDPIKVYGEKLLEFSTALQFDRILKILPEFSDMVEIINRI